MYEQFFGLQERPFDLTPNPKYVVLTEPHREALSNIEYGIASRKGITLLIGEAGSGKTTMVRMAIERHTGTIHSVHLQNPTLSRPEFAAMLAAQFGLSKDAFQSKTVMLLELEALLKRRHEQGETTVLVIDEAQSLTAELLEEIRLLANIETNEEKLLSVIIVGQPELSERLNDPSLRQLKQRVALRCELRGLSAQESACYLAGRIQAAGGVGARVFTREAVTLIHERARGLPRIISVIADNALIGGFANGQRPVNSHIVRDVCRDLDMEEGRDLSPGSDAGLGPVRAPSRLAVNHAPVAAAASEMRSPETDPESALLLSPASERPERRKRFSFFNR